MGSKQSMMERRRSQDQQFLNPANFLINLRSGGTSATHRKNSSGEAETPVGVEQRASKLGGHLDNFSSNRRLNATAKQQTKAAAMAGCGTPSTSLLHQHTLATAGKPLLVLRSRRSNDDH